MGWAKIRLACLELEFQNQIESVCGIKTDFESHCIRSNIEKCVRSFIEFQLILKSRATLSRYTLEEKVCSFLDDFRQSRVFARFSGFK